MSTDVQPDGSTAPDQQLQRELQSLIHRHAEFSRRLESVLTNLERGSAAPPLPPNPSLPTTSATQFNPRQLAQLDDRLSRVEEQLDAIVGQLGVISARVQEMLDSRTWRLITGAGGILLRLVGRRK